MTTPTEMQSGKLAYTGATLKLGTWTWTAVTGNFAGTKLVARFGSETSTVVELESDGVGDQGLNWSGGVLTDLELTADQVDLLLAGVGARVGFWIMLEEADPSTDTELIGIGQFTITKTGPDIP